MALQFKNRYWAIVILKWNKDNNKTYCRLGNYVNKEQRLANINSYLNFMFVEFYFDGWVDLDNAYILIKKDKRFEIAIDC